MDSGAMNIIEYVKRNQLTFSEDAFNPIDSLVFSTLVYLEWENAGLAPCDEDQRVLLHDLVALTDWNRLTTEGWYSIDARTMMFLQGIMASRRFRSVETTRLECSIDEDLDEQFAAMTFVFPAEEELAYVAYRGTDATFAGWREDMNLGVLDSIPSQSKALAYLNHMLEVLDCPLILGGHSKGGNLAEYAALMAAEEDFGRIQMVFSHDGPSFLTPPSDRFGSEEYQAICHKTLPPSSLVGLLLEKREDYHVVESDARGGVLQHVPYSWMCEGKDFTYLENLNAHALVLNESIESCLLGKPVEDRRLLLDAFFGVLKSTGCKTFDELMSSMPQSGVIIARELKNMDMETRGFISSVLSSLMESVWEGTELYVAGRTDELKKSATARMSDMTEEFKKNATARMNDMADELRKNAAAYVSDVTDELRAKAAARVSEDPKSMSYRIPESLRGLLWPSDKFE